MVVVVAAGGAVPAAVVPVMGAATLMTSTEDDEPRGTGMLCMACSVTSGIRTVGKGLVKMCRMVPVSRTRVGVQGLAYERCSSVLKATGAASLEAQEGTCILGATEEIQQTVRVCGRCAAT